MHTSLFLLLSSFTHRSLFLDEVIIFFARWFPWVVVIGVIIFLTKRPRKASVPLLVSVLFAWIISFILKIIIHAPRPFLSMPDMHQLLTYGGFNSFPSGHATFFSVLATSVYFLNKRMGIVLYFCALIIGIARIAAGLHFPVDIVGGYALGIISAWSIHFLFKSKNYTISS